jgi:hypothetical protein
MSVEAQFLTREQLLSPPALEEQVVSFPDFGDVLVGELTGDARAEITERLAKSSQDGEVDLRGYQRKLLALGILDPGSPEGARVPLLKDADVGVLMGKLGGGKVRELVETVEGLSGMGQKAQESAAKNSGSPASAVGTTA